MGREGEESFEGKGEAYTRREFLRRVGLVGAGLVLSRFLSRESEKELESLSVESNISEGGAQLEIKANLQPEVIHGTEVYYMTEMEQVTNFYRRIDRNIGWENKIPLNLRDSLGGRNSIRKEILDPSVRYVEFVVRESAFKSFERRKAETGVDFVEYAQMLVAAKNLCYEQASPPSSLRNVVKRILIIEDDALREVWPVEAERGFKEGKDYGLDLYYRETFRGNLPPGVNFKGYLPLDVDTSWAIAEDNRPSAEQLSEQNLFWEVSQSGGGIAFRKPLGDRIVREYRYAGGEPDSSLFDGREKVLLDFGLIHELMHYADSLPDEYLYDLHARGGKKFFLATGSFHFPRVSPFISAVAQNNERENIRDGRLEGVWKPYPVEGGSLYQEGLPRRVGLHGEGGLKVSRIGLVRENLLNTKDFDIMANEGEFNLTKDRLDSLSSRGLMLSCEFSERTLDLYLPYAVLIMTKLAGIEEAEYKVEALPISREIHWDEGGSQYLDLIHEENLDEQIHRFEELGCVPVARMKIEGTDSWGVWFQGPHSLRYF